jgi:hypothetical protein
MTQLKFDRKGKLAPQKISFKVKHDENTKEQLKNIELGKEVLRGLEVLGTNGVDIKTLTIWSNPNRVRGPDYQVKERILLILEKLVAEKKVAAKRDSPRSNKILFLLVNTKKG